MRRVELKLYHKDKEDNLRCLVGNVEDHLDLLSHQYLCKKELKSSGIEVSRSPVFGVIQGNVSDDVIKKRYNIKHHTELNE
jgi:hypothetical protein